MKTCDTSTWPKYIYVGGISPYFNAIKSKWRTFLYTYNFIQNFSFFSSFFFFFLFFWQCVPASQAKAAAICPWVKNVMCILLYVAVCLHVYACFFYRLYCTRKINTKKQPTIVRVCYKYSGPTTKYCQNRKKNWI